MKTSTTKAMKDILPNTKDFIEEDMSTDEELYDALREHKRLKGEARDINAQVNDKKDFIKGRIGEGNRIVCKNFTIEQKESEEKEVSFTRGGNLRLSIREES